MIEVQLNHYLVEFKNTFKETLLKHELYGIQDFDDLLDSLLTIVNSVEKNADLFIPIEEHKLDKYGMSEYAVRLRNNGMNLAMIANTLSTISGTGITEREVKEWFATYSNLTYTRKSKAYGNIFDIQERMQEIYANLSAHLEVVKDTDKGEFWKAKTTKQQVTLDIYKEIRFLTKDAKEIIKSINHQEKLNEFKRVVIETIRQIDPGTARTIIEKLEQDKALFNALLPPED